MHKAQRDLVAAMLREPQVIATLREQVPLGWYTDSELARLAEVLYEGQGAGGLPADLPDDLQSLAAKLTLQAAVSGEQGERLVNDCIRTIAEHKMIQRMGELRRVFAAAERGKEPVDPQLIKEYQDLARKAKPLDPRGTQRR